MDISLSLKKQMIENNPIIEHKPLMGLIRSDPKVLSDKLQISADMA